MMRDMSSEVLDELRLRDGVTLDGFERSRVLFDGKRAAAQQTRPAENGVQRCAKLVRHHRQKLVLGGSRPRRPCARRARS